ncbi:MAG: V-type ATPase subunit [Eubacterium sp.]
MEKEYTYGVARIRALESTLFSEDGINQLMQCKDYGECMNFLRDRGWGNGNPDQTLEEMLEDEHRKIWKILDEIVEDKNECKILTVNNEFHNLKAAIKSVCTGQKNEKIFISNCSLNPEFLKECIKQGNFSSLPDDMSEAAKEATEILLQTGDGQLCDVIIDRAALEAVKKAGRESDNELIRKYADVQVTIADIKIAVRCAWAGKDSQFVQKALVSCDGISVRELSLAVESGLEGVCNYLENTGFGEAVKALKKSKSVFECWCDNKIIEDIKPQKYNSFTLGPIVAYVLARENEIKTVKIILSGKLNGFDNEFIRERVRVMYA